MAQSPCFLSPLADSLLLPLLVPFTYLETLLTVIGSVHLGLRLLVNWPPLSQPFPIPYPIQIPRTQVTKCLTKTTSRIRLLLSGTFSICLGHSNVSLATVIHQCFGTWRGMIRDKIYCLYWRVQNYEERGGKSERWDGWGGEVRKLLKLCCAFCEREGGKNSRKELT